MSGKSFQIVERVQSPLDGFMTPEGYVLAGIWVNGFYRERGELDIQNGKMSPLSDIKPDDVVMAHMVSDGR